MEAGVSGDAAAGWTATVLVCRKCSKRVGGGWGKRGRKPLAKALRQQLARRDHPAAVLKVKCLGLCPQAAVTVVNGAAPRDWLLVQPGTDLNALVDQLIAGGSDQPA